MIGCLGGSGNIYKRLYTVNTWQCDFGSSSSKVPCAINVDGGYNGRAEVRGGWWMSKERKEEEKYLDVSELFAIVLSTQFVILWGLERMNLENYY